MKYLLRIVFNVFSAATAEFWNKTVVCLRAVRKLAFKHKAGSTTRQVGRPKPEQAVFYMFFSISL